MTKITPEQHEELLRVRTARAALRNWEDAFQARMLIQKEAECANNNRKLISSMWHAREAGASIATIGEYYGSKDSATITRKIAEYQTIVDEANANRAALEADANPYPQTA